MTELQSGARLQSSLGTNLTRANGNYIVDTLIIARVASINYQLNTVTFTPMSGSTRAQNASQGGNNAVLPMSFAGRNGYGRSYGEVEPIVVGDIILVGYVDSSNTNPIVIGRYPDSAIAKEVTAQRSPSYAPDDVDTYAQSHRKLTVYPDQTYSLHDGSGRMELTFSGNSFVLVNQETNVYSHATDDGDMPVNETNLAGHFDGAWEERTPLDRHAPEIVLRHNGTLDKDGNKDQHELYLYINQDGTYRTSIMNDDQDWRAYFEMTPDGKIRLRRQEDSKIFNSGSKSSELLIDENGYVTVRSQSSGLVVRPDGIYNLDGTKFTSDVDLSNNVDFKKVWDSIDETKDGLKENKAQIEINSHEIATKVSTDELPAAINDQLKPYDDSLKSLKDSYTGVQKTIDNMASDGVISSADKKATRTIWLQIQTEYPATIAQAEANGVDHTALDDAYTTLKSYLTPILLASGDTTIDSTEWDRDFSNYYNASYNVNTAIVAALRKLAQLGYDKAVTAAEDAGDAITQASEATSEDYLTGSDKATLGHVWIQIQNQYPNDVSSADAVKVNHSALDSAYNDLNTYIQTNNIFANNSTIPIDGETLANKIKAYFKQEASVLKQVADKNIQTLAEYGQDIDHQTTSIKETSTKIALSAENIQKHNDSLAVMQGQLNVMANQISGGVSETDVTGIVNDSLSGTGLGQTNQFILKTATKGQYMNGNNGSSSASANGIISDYIAVTAGTTYSAKVYGATGTVKLSLAWYDSNKSFISGTEQTGTGDVTNNGTAPTNASYAKVSTDDYNFNTLFIAGDAPSAWAPSYVDAKGNVDSANQLLKSLTDEQASVSASINANGNKKKTNLYNIGSMFVNGNLGSTDIGSLNGILTDISSDYSSDNSLATQYEVDISALNNYYGQLKDDINGLLGQAEGSSVDIDSYRAKLTDYYTIRDTFLQAVKGKIDSQVSSAKHALSDASDTANEVITNKYANFAVTVNGISTKVGEVTQTANDTKQGLANLQNTTTQKFSEIDQTSGEIKQTVSEVTKTANNANDKINNLQVGGTNMLPNTIDFSSWQMSSGVSIDSTIYPEVAHYPASTAGSADIDFLQYASLMSLVANTTYTFSFSAKGSGNLDVLIYPNVSASGSTDNVHQYALTSTYQKYSFTFTTSSSISGTKNVIFRNSNGNTLEAYITQVKLEQGNIATDWSPAPNDGLGIKSTTIMYQLGDSDTTPPEGTWLEAVPTLVKGMYLWTRTTLIYTDNSSESIYSVTYIAKDGDVGPKGADGLPGAKGADGRTAYAHFAYANSQDGNTDFSTTASNRKYIGFYSDFTSGDSTNPSAYNWSLIKGADGADGKDGVPGKAGADGKTPYFHIAYADSADGNTNFSLDTPASRKYIGSYTDFTQTDSTNPSLYSWQLVQGPKGDTGADGIAGKDGVGLKSTQIMYAQSTSGTTAPTTGWTAQVPTLIKGQYLWTQTTWVYTDNTGEAGYTVSYNAKDGNDGTNGVAGKDGTGIKTTTITYAGSTSGTTAPTTGFTSAIPTVDAGNYLWTKTIWTYTDGTSETGYSVAMMGNTGPAGKDGSQGVAGAPGKDGKTPYLHTAWSWSSDGKDRFTVAYPGENLLLGTSSTNAKTLTGTGWVIGSSASNANYIPVLAGEKLTYSAVITNITSDCYLELGFYDSSKKLITNLGDADNARGSVPGTWHATVIAPANSAFVSVRIVIYSQPTSQSVSFIKEKLVRGDYDGIYTPNPSEDSINAYPAYRGEYTDYTADDSTDPSKYTWVKVKGDTGTDGLPGKDGVGITATAVTYQSSTSGTTAPTGTWLTVPPTVSAGKFLWTRMIWTYTDGTTETGYSVGHIGADGSDGLPGKAGADGRTPYFHQAWADSSDGKTNFSATASLGKKYLGTYTDYVVADSTDPTKYKWTELVGAIEIGGTNYLANTGTPWKTQGSGGANLTSGNNWLFTFGKINQAPFKDGEYVTLSFDYTSVGTGAYGTISPQFNQTPWGGLNGSESMNDTGHVVRTVQWQPGWTSGTANGIQIRMDNVANTRTVTVYNMQFELGNKATDWSPAPEDNASASDLAKTNQTVNTVVTQTAKNWSVLAQGIGGSSAGISVDGNGTVSISGGKLVIGSDLIANDIKGKTITGSTFANTSGTFSIDTDGNIKGATISGSNVELANLDTPDGTKKGFLASDGLLLQEDYKNATHDYDVVHTDVDLGWSGQFVRNDHKDGSYDYAGINALGTPDLYATRWNSNNQMTSTISLDYNGISATILDSSGKYKNSALSPEQIIQLSNVGHLLWSGAAYMNGTQTVTPSLSLNDCLTGWLLEWQLYVNGAPNNTDIMQTPIFKSVVNAHSGKGFSVDIGIYQDTPVRKYLFPTITSIKGTGANTTGISHNFVLTSIYAF